MCMPMFMSEIGLHLAYSLHLFLQITPFIQYNYCSLNDYFFFFINYLFNNVKHNNMYVHTAPPESRGSLVTCINVAITGGQFVSCLIAGSLSTTQNGWRL